MIWNDSCLRFSMKLLNKISCQTLIFVILTTTFYNSIYAQKDIKESVKFTQEEFDNNKIDSDTYNFWWYKSEYMWFPKNDTIPYFVDDRQYKGLVNYGLEFSLIDRTNVTFLETLEMHRLNININDCSFNPNNNIIEIKGSVTGGWPNGYHFWFKKRENNVDVFIGEKRDTIKPLFLNYLFDPKTHVTTYNGKRIFNHIALDSFPSFYIDNYEHFRTDEGNTRTFRIKTKIDKNSLLIFGLGYSYAEIFDIGKLVFDINASRKRKNQRKEKTINKHTTTIIRNNIQLLNKDVSSKPEYFEIVEQAENFILKKQYAKAEQLYNKFLTENRYVFARDMHNAVRCAVFSRDYDTAIIWCKKLALKGVPLSYFDAKIFDRIKKLKMWNDFLSHFDDIHEKYKEGLNLTLINSLRELVEMDQKDYIKNSKGQIEASELLTTTEYIDGKLIDLIKKEGFPTEEKIGVEISKNGHGIKTSPMFFVLFIHSYQKNSNRLGEIKKIMNIASKNFEYDSFRDNLNIVKIGGNTCLKIYKGNLYNSKSCRFKNELQLKKVIFKFNNQHGFLIDDGEYLVLPFEHKNEEEDEKYLKERFDFVQKLTDDWFFYEH